MSNKRILLIRFSSIGDVILTTPLIKAIKQNNPEATLDFIILNEFSSLVKHNPYIDNLIPIERKKNIYYYIRTAISLRKKNYDQVIDLHRSTRSLIFRLFLKAENKNRLNKKYFNRFLLTFFKLNLYKSPYSVVERYFKAAGIKLNTDDYSAEFWLNSKDLQFSIEKINKITGADFSLKELAGETNTRITSGLTGRKKTFISLMPFAKWQTKEWGDFKYTRLGLLLAERTDAQILILGGAGDAKRAAAIAESIGSKAISLAGMLNLPETAIVLSASACLVSNDTGVMHIAGATGTPVVAIFGCTTEELGFFPVSRNTRIIQLPLYCRPCTAKGLPSCPKKHFKCMNNISVDIVFDAAKNFIHI